MDSEKPSVTHDPLPERLIMAGCLLLLVPCALTLIGVWTYAWPLIVYPFTQLR